MRWQSQRTSADSDGVSQSLGPAPADYHHTKTGCSVRTDVAEYYLRELSHGLFRLACLSAGTTLPSFAKPLRYLELGFGQRHRRRRDGDFEVRFNPTQV